MENSKLKELIKESIVKLLNNTISDTKINDIKEKHNAKVHFVPVRYRIFSGLLQSLNIQFGNFIEVLISHIFEKEERLEIISDLSGKKNIVLSLNKEVDSLIDSFITSRQTPNNDDLSKKFEQLLEDILKAQNISSDNFITAKHDIDLLFKDKEKEIYYYVEIKYNDDHDTGKFVDINRKFIKTYAALVKKLDIKDVNKLKPILYYFNKKIMKGNIYVPENTNIYRGEKLFNEFSTLKYSELDDYLKNVSEDKEIVEIFDNLYKKIRYGI